MPLHLASPFASLHSRRDLCGIDKPKVGGQPSLAPAHLEDATICIFLHRGQVGSKPPDARKIFACSFAPEKKEVWSEQQANSAANHGSSFAQLGAEILPTPTSRFEAETCGAERVRRTAAGGICGKESERHGGRSVPEESRSLSWGVEYKVPLRVLYIVLMEIMWQGAGRNSKTRKLGDFERVGRYWAPHQTRRVRLPRDASRDRFEAQTASRLQDRSAANLSSWDGMGWDGMWAGDDVVQPRSCTAWERPADRTLITEGLVVRVSSYRGNGLVWVWPRQPSGRFDRLCRKPLARVIPCQPMQAMAWGGKATCRKGCV